VTADEIARLRYYQRQFLGAGDFNDQQAYHRDMRRRHNLGPHTWGIVAGLGLSQQDRDGGPSAGVDVYVEPGMAVDIYGREIVVFEPYRLDASLFAAFPMAKACSVWIRYDEQQANPAAVGYQQCNTQTEFTRIRETFVVVVEPNLNEQGSIVVAGLPRQIVGSPGADALAIPPDRSVPYQEFPDPDPSARWLIRLGTVSWDGTKLVKASADLLPAGRIYIGAIADHVLGPAGTLELAPRFKPADPDQADFAGVEGRLRVDGRLTAQKDVYVPAGTLDFGSATRQMINLWSTPDKTPLHQYGIGVQANTTYLRSHNHFCWFKDGVHSDTTADPGAGGTLQLELDSQGRLFFSTQNNNQALNLWNQNYGMGAQNNALYQRSNLEFRWWRGGSHQQDPQAGGNGALAMKLDGTSTLAVSGGLTTGGNVIAGTGGDAQVLTRHVKGKNYKDDSLDNLFLNWETGTDVIIGRPGGTESSLHVSGNLIVDGSNNIFKIETFTLAVVNAGQNAPAQWNQPFIGFQQVFGVFAVLQGFSIWGNPSPTFGNWSHSANDNAIPQHVFVRVEGWSNTFAFGACYCSESDAGNETDNTVLFTLVVFGRGSV